MELRMDKAQYRMSQGHIELRAEDGKDATLAVLSARLVGGPILGFTFS